MIHPVRILLPRSLVTSAGVLDLPVLDTSAAKATLAVKVESRVGSLDYTPSLRAYDPAAREWFSLWTPGSPFTASSEWTFYDMNRLFPPSDLVEMLLPPRPRVRLTIGGSGSLVLTALWADLLSTRQSA